VKTRDALAPALIGEGRVLLAAGRNEQREEFEGIGLWFVASQVFTRVP